MTGGGGELNKSRHVHCDPAMTLLRIFNASMLALKCLLSFYVYPLTRLWEVQSDHD